MGEVNFRNDRRRFGLWDEDRLQHLYVIGKTGVGKSSLIETMALQDIQRGLGVCVIDPHGDMVSSLEKKIQGKKVHYLDLSSGTLSLGYNPLKGVSFERIPLVASGFLDTLKNAFSDAWGTRVEHFLRNALYALLETRGTKLSDISKILSDKDYRYEVVRNLKNETVKSFWLKEFPSYSPGYRQDGVSSIQNKLVTLPRSLIQF